MINIFKNEEKNNLKNEQKVSQAGKTYEEILPSLLSGEADDLSEEFTNEIK